MKWQADVLFTGNAKADVLRLDAPISFWGGVDPVTSKIVLANHPQLGLPVANKILVIPQLVGSSSSSAVMLELVYKKMAPQALVLCRRDAILPIGVLVAQQMDWPTIPVVVLADAPFQSGEHLQIDESGTITKCD